MDLNTIELSPYLIAQLYPKELVSKNNTSNDAVDKIIASPILSEEKNWVSLGENQKNVLICMQYTTVLHLPDAQLQFLTQLLKACRLSLKDVALINKNNYAAADYQSILGHFTPKVVLLFGLTPEAFGFPFSIPDYQVQEFAAYTVMGAAALELLENDKNAKGKLWTSLKKIFNV